MNSILVIILTFLILINYSISTEQNVTDSSINEEGTSHENGPNCDQMWLGVAPFCGEKPCPDGFEVIRNDKCGDGKCCWSGEKTLCKSCTECALQYVGTFPFCSPAGCPSGWKLKAFSDCGDGSCCWTGHKMKCVKNECNIV